MRFMIQPGAQDLPVGLELFLYAPRREPRGIREVRFQLNKPNPMIHQCVTYHLQSAIGLATGQVTHVKGSIHSVGLGEL